MTLEEEINLEVEKEAAFMAEKWCCDKTLAKIMIFHGYGMGLKAAQKIYTAEPTRTKIENPI